MSRSKPPASKPVASPEQGSGTSFAASAATRPHLALMRDTAEGATDRSRAGLGLLMLWLCDDIEQRANASLAPFGLSESKFDLLMFFGLAERGLIESQAVTPSYIADYFGVTRSTVTGLLDWLEKRDLLRRRLSTEDRRSFALELTEQGRELLERSLPVFWGMCESLTSSLDQDECALLQKVLGKLWVQLKAD
ncbi:MULTISPECIES: MarR family winged helix-turn-helix transcriptional regulator [Pseudomonas]|nr:MULTISPECIES: MarR family transcriptional regulator [Pseudomonas]AZC20264.1 Transcriptional regulator, MarR family [Pseudomonas sp. CMR5c]MCU7650506.1 MarR family transcriptional regulator [Pseudomonas piscis]